TDRDVVAERRAELAAGDVDDRAVLDVRARADPDRHDVAAHDGRVPDRAVVADHDVADDGAGLGEKHARADDRLFARKLPEHQRERRAACSTAAYSSSRTAGWSSASGTSGVTYCTTPALSITMKWMRSPSLIAKSTNVSLSVTSSGTSSVRW